jgi:hypothetical protein
MTTSVPVTPVIPRMATAARPTSILVRLGRR